MIYLGEIIPSATVKRPIENVMLDSIGKERGIRSLDSIGSVELVASRVRVFNSRRRKTMIARG